MEKNSSLFWAIVWTIVFISAIVGIFWNPSQFITAALSGAMAVCFFADYRKTKNL